MAGDPVPAINANGLAQFFVRGRDGAVYTKHQLATGGSWSGWGSLGGYISSNPSISQNADGRLQLFVRGTDDCLYTKWQQSIGGNWSDWMYFGGSALKDPFAFTHSDGRQEIFTLWADRSIRSRWQYELNGSWGNWGSFGGGVDGVPIVRKHRDGRAQLVVRGTDNLMYTRWLSATSGWLPWSSFGGSQVFMSDLSGQYSARSGLVHYFGLGADRAVYTIGVPSNQTWHSLGGYVSNVPTATCNQDDRLHLFVRGTDGIMYQKFELLSGGWSGWTELR